MSRPNLLLAAVAAALVCLTYLLRSVSPPLAELVADPRWLCSPDEPRLPEDLEFLTSDTPFSGKWSINARPEPSRLNLYFLCKSKAADMPAPLRRFEGNCAYADEPNIVICDAFLFSTFIDRSGLSGEIRTSPSFEENRRSAERNIAFWILGHEIGHVVGRHRGGHFMGNGLEKIATASSFDHQFELDADRWFVRQLGRDPARQSAVEVTLLDLIYAQVRRKVGSNNLYPATGVPITSQWIDYSTSGSHPEFVIRASRMLSLSFDRPDAAFMKYQIDQFAQGLRVKH